MLPIHPLLSDAGALNDPHRQWARLCESLVDFDPTVLEATFRLALRVHTAQWRKTARDAPPVPYIVHPVRVARILVEEWRQPGFLPIATALLHDVLEDCPPEKQAETAREITHVAGDQVCDAVWTLTKPRLPEPVPPETRARRDAEYFTALRASEHWVRLVKCADRVDNLRDALRWGEKRFWARYSSETIGWHLLLARETSAIAEVALFKELVDGERSLNGRVPVWADGHLIDPAAAALIPEHIALRYQVIGLALRGDTLVLGVGQLTDDAAREDIRRTLKANGHAIQALDLIPISVEALQDALIAGLYGRLNPG